MKTKSEVLTFVLQLQKLAALLYKTGLKLWEHTSNPDDKVMNAIKGLVAEDDHGEKMRQNVLLLATKDVPVLTRVSSDHLGVDFIVLNERYGERKVIALETHGSHKWGHNNRIMIGEP
ncbi:hypothetical protein CL628_03860, partial [bacterium]|nr:hypothetical protein [bacterium]